MKKYNYIVSVIMIALAGYILYECSTYSIGSSAQKNPAVWPTALAVGLIILSVALIIETIFKKETDEEKNRVVIDWKSEGMKKVYIALLLLIAFVIVMKFLGMLIALFLLIPCLMWLMGCRSKVMLIVYPICLTLFVYVFFVVIMKITLPQPIWA